MALIEYPNDNWNAFISLTDCDTFIAENIPSSQRTSYDALSNTDKEIYIRQATILISEKITIPDTLEEDLKKATAYLVNYSVGVDMLNYDSNSNIKKEVIDDGTIETEYFSQSRGSSQFPPIVESLLSNYSYNSSGSFGFERA